MEKITSRQNPRYKGWPTPEVVREGKLILETHHVIPAKAGIYLNRSRIKSGVTRCQPRITINKL